MTERTLPLSSLTALTPLDGRYRDRVVELAPYFSEQGLIRTRVEVESRYLIALSRVGVVRPFTPSETKQLEEFGPSMPDEQVARVKEIEDVTRHDVKAMEKVFREMLTGSSLEDVIEMIHYGLTSEDVNNLSYRLMIDRARKDVMLPAMDGVVTKVTDMAEEYAEVPVLARTHGQAAVPTTAGKELVNTAMRLHEQRLGVARIELRGKLNGAVGNYNAVEFAHPEIDWQEFSGDFIESLGLVPNDFTTQINPYDDVIELFQAFQRFNGALIDFNQDMWRYISDDWFTQEAKKGEVGSSTMPQKVNPIDFENSEGNLGMANAMMDFFVRKLAVSRLQRDLSDSTVIRNFGPAFGYQLLAYKNSLVGLGKVHLHTEKVTEVLHENWAILTEPVQTLLREAGVPNAYDLVKGLARGEKIGESEWSQWVEQLEVPSEVKGRLLTLHPSTYIGRAVSLTRQATAEIRNS